MKSRIVLGLMLLISTAGLTQDKRATSPDSNPPAPVTFGDASFNVPPGWRYVEKQSGTTKFLLIVPPDIAENSKLAILVLPGQDLNGATFPQTLDRILRQGVAANEHLVEYSEVPPRKAAEYDLVTRAMVAADEKGHRSFRICFAANPRDRLEMVIVSADTTDLIKRYEAEIASLLSSLSYTGRSVGNGATDTAATQPRSHNAVGGTVPTDRGKAAIGGRRATSIRPLAVPSGTRTQVRNGQSVLLCKDPARLDFAMDSAKNGLAYLAAKALQHDAFLRVNGPVFLEVRESELQSRWPKVFVTVLDGDSAGRTGWVLLSELTNLKELARN